MDYKVLAKAIERIDGGCDHCIAHFLRDAKDAFNMAQRKEISKHFDANTYPMMNLFEYNPDIMKEWGRDDALY